MVDISNVPPNKRPVNMVFQSYAVFPHMTVADNVAYGLVVDKVGTSSVIYRIGLFQGPGEEAAAEGRFVHVYVDNTDPARPVVPMPAAIRTAVTPLLR